MWHSCGETIRIWPTQHQIELDYTVSKGTVVKVNRQDKFDGLYAMGSLGGGFGIV